MHSPRFDWDDRFSDFLDSLNIKEQAKLIAMIEKIEEYGLLVAQRKEWIKKIDNNLYEIRVHAMGNAIRGIYFQVKQNNYFITHGFIKKRNRTPKKEIEIAKAIRNKFQEKQRK